MKIFSKERCSNGRRHIYFCGIKIASYKKHIKQKECWNNNLSPDVLYVSLAEGGGIGDCIMIIPYLKAIVEQAPCKIVLDIYSRFPFVFNGLDFITNNIKYSSDFNEIPLKNYDVSFLNFHYGMPFNINENKIKKLYPNLFTYIEKSQEMTRLGLNQIHLIDYFALINGKKRYQQFDVRNVFNVQDSYKLNIFVDENDTLNKFNLKNKKYFLINRDVDNCLGDTHPKLWAMKNYKKLVQLLKSEFSDIKVIQIGANDNCGIIPGTDESLIGKTSFEELKVLLKHTEYLISSEGGLNHLSHFIGGKSVVLFGPNEVRILGYPENINIQGHGCPAPCCWVVNSWNQECCLHKNPSPCMESITPEMVVDEIKNSNTKAK